MNLSSIELMNTKFVDMKFHAVFSLQHRDSLTAISKRISVSSHKTGQPDSTGPDGKDILTLVALVLVSTIQEGKELLVPVDPGLWCTLLANVYMCLAVHGGSQRMTNPS